MEHFVVASDLSISDHIVLQNLIRDVKRHKRQDGSLAEGDEGYISQESAGNSPKVPQDDDAPELDDEVDINKLKALNDPTSPDYEPSITSMWDLRDMAANWPPAIHRHIILPYASWAKGFVRHETDVIMLTHLLLYLTTSVTSAIMLYRNFHLLHGILHFAMQFYYMGPYTLMMHQHIHMGGVLAKTPLLGLVDKAFPYILDPLMGHTWNSYYYHHVKHHHVEGNGPSDLSSTIRYQRDDVFHFLHYLGRFFFFVWFDLPLYFLKKGQIKYAIKAGGWELLNYTMLYTLYRLNSQATTFVLLCPFLLMRLGLMIGNWAQHAFVDADEPDSDFRSSITLIDVPSNRYCYNDGYHTSHHLNPRRHWRDHPAAFLQQKGRYRDEQALVFHNIDYLMVSLRLLMKDYDTLAKCLVPMGKQVDLTLEERAAMLRRHTKKFSEEEIREKFGKEKSN